MQYTPEFVERGYNNRAAVPEHPQWFAKYAAWSQAARDRYQPARNLRYGENPKETLDLFVPAAKPRGTFVFIHGGYWRALDKDDFAFVAGPFVEQGIAVANVNYDLCPAVSIGTIVDECRRALAWVARDGPQHGASAGNVVVGGHSAGGHLAAMMFATDWPAHGLAQPPFVGGVTLSGVHDLAPMVHFSFNADFKLDAAEAARLSPVTYGSRTAGPLADRVWRRRDVRIPAAGEAPVGRVARQPAAQGWSHVRPGHRPLQRGRRVRGSAERAHQGDAGAVLATNAVARTAVQRIPSTPALPLRV